MNADSDPCLSVFFRVQNHRGRDRFSPGAILLALAIAGCAPLSPPTAMPATATPHPAHAAQATPAPVGGSVGDRPQRAAQTVTVVPASALEARYGIRVTLLAVTAAGGMVDFRFRVVDPGKARRLMEDGVQITLIPEGSRVKLAAPKPHTMDYQADQVYFILFGNAGGVVKSGTPVSVVVGDFQLEPIIAK